MAEKRERTFSITGVTAQMTLLDLRDDRKKSLPEYKHIELQNHRKGSHKSEKATEGSAKKWSDILRKFTCKRKPVLKKPADKTVVYKCKKTSPANKWWGSCCNRVRRRSSNFK